MIPDKDGVWSFHTDHPPITVLTFYGVLMWRQIGCDEWSEMDTLRDLDWKPLWTFDQCREQS